VASGLVYSKVKEALGLDQAKRLTTGAAPLQVKTREYFLSFNMFIVTVFGMSELTAPQTYVIGKDPKAVNLKSVGGQMAGTEVKVASPDASGDGELYFRGRNGFMGYLKEEKSTMNTIDKERFVHSGDIGHIDKYGNMVITGRLKELLVTSGGENIAPVLIENEVKLVLPFISNIVVVGDQKNFVAALITLKNDVDSNGVVVESLSKEAIDGLKSWGIEGVKMVKDLENNEKFRKIVEEGIEKANKKAISKVHHIRKWCLLERDLSIAGDELTPTLKIKRNIVHKKYHDKIERMYTNAKL